MRDFPEQDAHGDCVRVCIDAISVGVRAHYAVCVSDCSITSERSFYPFAFGLHEFRAS